MKPVTKPENNSMSASPKGKSLFYKPILFRSLVWLLAAMNLFCYSCRNKEENKTIHNKKTFRYIGKNTKDTIRFYGYDDLDTAIYYAKKERKNILLIFTGDTYMSMPGMEWRTLALYGDNDKIQNHFIIARLAVDNPEPAKDSTRTVFWHGQNRQLLTKGDQYKYLEETMYSYSTQPMFCFMDTLKRPIGNILGYNCDVKKTSDFINEGIRLTNQDDKQVTKHR
ncbi:MAG: hypothetical protein JST26_07280 [Bacteroidetes bacterium]|nr:hypothetical protein [Bacteroidota bacterium]